MFDKAIVEKVLSGDRLIARLLVDPTKHIQTIVLIAGIRTPSTARSNPADGKEQPGEPFGDEAQRFVDSRLLQRNVKIVIRGASPQGQLVGDVKHPVNGSIAPYLLKSGLARCADHHTTMLGQEMAALRQAEREARDARAGIFHGLASSTKAKAGEADAVVTRVQTADTLYIRSKAGAEKRVNLSSVRAPKQSDPKQAPWGAEAKEFARKKLIGKHVKVTTDGKRPAQEGYEEREMVTVVQGNTNITLLLVENGYASVIRHRQDDSDRSPIYDDLQIAEKTAQDEGRGMWNPKPPAPPQQYVDYSESLEKAKRQLSFLSRQKKVPAIVDFVKSSSRFAVLVPRESAKLTFVLSGIRAPKSARNPNEKSEPFGQEAHDFANRRCLQRDVEIDVEDNDKVGGFIGTLYVNRENFARLLLEEGLATVHTYSAEKTGNANELLAAEKKAKEGRKGMWHDWDPSKEDEYGGGNGNEMKSNTAAVNGASSDKEASNSSSSSQRPKDYRDVIVTHIDESGHLKLQQVGSGTAALTELMSAFRSFHINKTNDTSISATNPPKAGDLVAARFTEDDEWYRARVRRNDREGKKSEVIYIDYGNSEIIPWARLRSLNQAQFSTQKLRPQAVDAMLSFVQLPSAENNKDYLREAMAFITERTEGRQLVASVDTVLSDGSGGGAGGTLSVTLFDPQVSSKMDMSLNADVVGEGYAMVPKKFARGGPGAAAGNEVLAGLRKRQEEAKAERRGMWEYGDLSVED